jgi:death-on-curing protein
MESIVGNHPFVDGTKRTAITSAGIFLRMNGYLVDTTQDELYRFTMAMAEGAAGRNEAEKWLRAHSRLIS